MGTMKKLGSGSDVVTYLKGQHEQIKALFTRVVEASGTARDVAFRDLRRMLAVHETAEEEIIHPAVKSLPGGEAIVAARLREENAAKKALVILEKLHVDSPEFDSKIRALERDVLAHAESEETFEFDRLAATLDEAKLQRMTKAVELAESFAPTRPHPGVESQAANMFAGPFAAMLDRARDALSGKA
jgi:hemerythrin superfamily protein